MNETPLLRSIYNRSPVFFQNLMASVMGWQKNRYRYGSRTARQWREFYRQTAAWPQERLDAYQLQQLRELLLHARQFVPFYRRRFRQAGFDPEAVRSLEDLQTLPLLTKDEIRAHCEELISERYDKRALQAHTTSGSTGMPLTLLNDREAATRSFNFFWAQCRPGLDFRDRKATFTGLEIVLPERTRPPFWRMNYAAHQRMYSVFHMNDRNLPHYVEDLQRFRPAFFYGYPSALYILADFMLRNGLRLPQPPKCAIVSSEECLPEYRRAIEEAFQCRVWNEYGMGEMAAMAFECECGKLHVKTEYSAVEFLPTGRETPDGEVFEMIGTSTINPAWPLIRYQMGDLAVIQPDAKCPLGRPGRVIERIEGRSSHILITADGSRVSNISVMAKKCRNLLTVQAIQERPGEVILHVVPGPQWNRGEDEPHMVAEFRKKLGDESRMKIRVDYAREPVRTSSGKVLMIVSRMSSAEREAAAAQAT